MPHSRSLASVTVVEPNRGGLIPSKGPRRALAFLGKGMPLDTGNRIPSVDGLRAVSFACVLLTHLSGTRHFLHFLHCDVIELCGNFGEWVFFVTSGYLITILLLKEQERRAARCGSSTSEAVSHPAGGLCLQAR